MSKEFHPYLLISTSKGEIKFPLSSGNSWTIGRDNNNNFIIREAWISRNHAMIHKTTDQKFYLTDLGSSNGCYLNGKRINGSTILKNQAQIFLGRTKLKFYSPVNVINSPVNQEIDKETSTSIFHKRRLLSVILVELCVTELLNNGLDDNIFSMVIDDWFAQAKSIFSQGGIVINKSLGNSLMAIKFHEQKEPKKEELVQIFQVVLTIYEITSKLIDKYFLSFPLEIGVAINTGNAMVKTNKDSETMDYDICGELIDFSFDLKSAMRIVGKNLILGAQTYSYVSQLSFLKDTFEATNNPLKHADKNQSFYTTDFDKLFKACPTIIFPQQVEITNQNVLEKELNKSPQKDIQAELAKPYQDESVKDGLLKNDQFCDLRKVEIFPTAKNFPLKLLGSILQQAELVSGSQIEIALRDQIQSNQMKIGEILALRGWIKQETADFFAERWPNLLRQKSKQPLGHYLKEAALLSENQIRAILSQQKQKQLQLRFGTLVILNGWLKPTTIEFFLNYFYPERPSTLRQNYSLHRWPADKSSNPLEVIREGLIRNKHCNPTRLLRLYQQILLGGEVVSDSSKEQAELIKLGLVVKHENKLQVASNLYQAVFNPCWVDGELRSLDRYSKIKLKLLKLDQKASLPYRLLTEILSWTGSQPFLVQKLVHIIHESELFVAAGEEAAWIEKLVQTRVIENWQNQAAGEHLKEICDRLLHNQQCGPLSLLKLYQEILRQKEVPANNSLEQAELVYLGLIMEQEGNLRVANPIYQAVFNLSWIEKELNKMIESHSSLN
jgi:pSer/pThr/pTyr-binding forkhead associated (FHA) protein